MSNDDKGDVVLILDLRYSDFELFESARATFVSAVDEMLSLHHAAEVLSNTAVGRVDIFASNASGVFPISSDTAADALRELFSLSPVRNPPHDSDRRVISCVQDLFVSSAHRRTVLFMTTFTAIGDFCHLAHASRLLAVSFMESAWISLHIDATALTTTSLSLTPSVRAVRSPAAPSRVRGALQRAIAPALQLQPRVCVSLRVGRFAVPCVAQRPYLRLPARCCAAEDFLRSGSSSGSSGSAAAVEGLEEDLAAMLVLGAQRTAASLYERERRATTLVALRAEGIVPAAAVGEDELYGDGWALLPRDSDGHNNNSSESHHHNINNINNNNNREGNSDGRAAEDWLRHIAEELRGDLLVLSTQQPHLDPPHQLALPSATFVAFALSPGQLYMRGVVPPELRAERADCDAGSGGGGFGFGGGRRRLDAAIAEEMKRTAEALRECGMTALSRPAGVGRMAAQLRRNDVYTIQLERRQLPQARRALNQSLHGNRF